MAFDINNSKIIVVEEKEYEEIPFEGEIDPNNPPKPQYREKVLFSRKFQLQKFTARDSLKAAKIITAKLLPLLNTVMPSKSENEKPDIENLTLDKVAEILSGIDYEKVARALDLIDEGDLDKLINLSLMHTYEQLSAGLVQVLNPNGTYGVAEIEYDLLLTLRLTAEAILWSAGSFLSANRWRSMFSPLADLIPQGAST